MLFLEDVRVCVYVMYMKSVCTNMQPAADWNRFRAERGDYWAFTLAHLIYRDKRSSGFKYIYSENLIQKRKMVDLYVDVHYTHVINVCHITQGSHEPSSKR